MRLVLGIFHVPALANIEDFVRKIIDSARDADARCDGVSYVIPCKNTGNVVRALGKFSDGHRDKV